MSRIPLGNELALAAIALAGWFALPQELGFLTQIIATILFVLSLDLVIGFAGIPSLGQAAMFGSGAYAAGLAALHLTGEPLTGLLLGGLAGLAAAALSGALILRTHGLTFLMLTIAVAQLLYEIANKASAITGGDDGLSGFQMSPLLGLWAFDFAGRTAYVYAACVLVACFAVLRRLAASPFGLTCLGIKSDAVRMAAIGCNVPRHLLTLYAIAGFFAGVAGALATQTTQAASLATLDFQVSAEALIMLVLGGAGRLWGAVLGTILFMVVHHVAAAFNPYHWMFVIGAMLILAVLLLPKGLIDGFDRLTRRRAP